MNMRVMSQRQTAAGGARMPRRASTFALPAGAISAAAFLFAGVLALRPVLLALPLRGIRIITVAPAPEGVRP